MRFGRYTEDGNVTLVEILADAPDLERGGRAVRVKALEWIRQGQLCKMPDIGAEWESWAAENAEPYCWQLMELDESDPSVVDYMQASK